MSQLKVKIKLGGGSSSSTSPVARPDVSKAEAAPHEVSVLGVLRRQTLSASSQPLRRMRPVFRGDTASKESKASSSQPSTGGNSAQASSSAPMPPLRVHLISASSSSSSSSSNLLSSYKRARKISNLKTKPRIRDYSVWESVAKYKLAEDACERDEATESGSANGGAGSVDSSAASKLASGGHTQAGSLVRLTSHRGAVQASMSLDEMKSLWREAQAQHRGQLARKLQIQEIEKKIKEDRAREIQALRAQAQEEEARRKREEDEAKEREERARNEAREKARLERERLARTIDMDAQNQIMEDGDDDDDDDDDDMGGF